jgi:uncharacterized Zn-binding protein involved in type VI secretion
MPGISRDNDTAVGDLIPSQTTVFANGELVIVDGDDVEGHGTGAHASPKMIAGSNNVFIGGVAVVNAGDLATCGDASTGSANVNVGD